MGNLSAFEKAMLNQPLDQELYKPHPKNEERSERANTTSTISTQEVTKTPTQENIPQFRSSAVPQNIKKDNLSSKRKVTYQGIGIYEDQYYALRDLQTNIQRTTHKKPSLAELLGEALDDFFKKKRA
jgi:hypothetical protein